MSACLVCLAPVEGQGDYHPACARALFGAGGVPEIDIDLARLHTLGLAMVGHTALSGIQRKVSVEFTRGHLQLATEGGRFILKPQAQTFPALPENEHATMRLAAAAGIEIPTCGLVRLKDGSLAYLVRRFDRLDSGAKALQEDFCQLANRAPKEKYQGSAELCARLLLRYASEPLVETRKLFRQLVFAWWTGNGDLHLKNLSLLRGGDGLYRLSPAYDLLCTRLVITDDPLALPVAGNRRNVTRRQWMELAAACRLPPRAAERILDGLLASGPELQTLVARSLLPAEMREHYLLLLRERAEMLRGERPARALTPGV